MREWSVECTSTIAITISMTMTPPIMTARCMAVDGITRSRVRVEIGYSVHDKSSPVNPAEQKTQRIRKALGPLGLVMSCALVDTHLQATIVEARAAESPFKLADIFHHLFVFILAARF